MAVPLNVRVTVVKKRSRAGSRPAKARPTKALKRKGRRAAKPVPRPSLSPSGQETEVARLTRELNEALEQQAAISDILRVISNSPSDVHPVLDAVAQHAARICEAQVVDVAIIDNELLRYVATFGELGRHSSEEPLSWIGRR
jgi:hypothetical protein